MLKSEKQLLNNALDALDRLFDRESSVFEIWALFFATSHALSDTDHQPEFEAVVPTLLAIARSRDSVETQRDRALDATDSLRLYLARLPID
ncbi:MAG: hypothetical protein J0M17_09155 [Planctomycetes bacterium]|nr:hypothetical protein [Planctomycetota bacterium]